MNERYETFLRNRLIPLPREFKAQDGLFPLTDDAAVTVTAEDPEAQTIVKEFFRKHCFSEPAVAFHPAKTDLPAEGYRLEVTPEHCTISGKDLSGVRHALQTIRQLMETERGVTCSRKKFLPCVIIRDWPEISFRALHLCYFPETPDWELERQIRLAAYYKFNYVILESWGMIRLDSHPEFCWHNAVPKAGIRRLVNLAKELGVTMIPQFNLFGHAAVSRCGSGKHILLDRYPEYESLFEPDGWTWCISSPAARQYIEDIVTELHDLFGKPAFFHIGCDEAYNSGSCSLCEENFPEKLIAHIRYFHDLLAKRGARAMMWHDMLLSRTDHRWDGYIRCGNEPDCDALKAALPKDMIVCDWQYGYPEKDGKAPEWITTRHFMELGFDTVVCPWNSTGGTIYLGRFAEKNRCFGFLQTVWHTGFTSSSMDTIFVHGAYASWNPESLDSPLVTRREFLNHHVRQINYEMGLDQYVQMGTVQYQIDATPHQ